MTQSETSGRLFCFGYGYTAGRLAGELRGEGWRIAGTTRSEDKFTAMREDGVFPFLFDGTTPAEDLRSELRAAGHVLLSVPPGDDGDPVFNALERPDVMFENAAWIAYLSTTGVYGDRGGAWVDEETEPAPTTKRGKRRLKAERQWLSLFEQNGLPVHIFRLPGIYGPGRSQIERVMDGGARAIVKPGQVFSRIHVDDIAAVLRASIARPDPGAVYNVCDDEPAPPQDVLAYAAQLLGLDPPPEVNFDEADLSEMAKSFYSENKRVRNARIKADLGVSLEYPTYREGLAAIKAAL